MDDQPNLTPKSDASNIETPPTDRMGAPASAAVDTEITSPLARFHGERPPAPRWYERVIAKRPERSFVEVEGAPIELLTWGERGKPGLLFVHGGRAHADWWSFIAPFFAKDFRVAAISFSGNGRSGWRETYTVDQYADEAVAAMRVGGLLEAGVAPTVVAHSFGSRPALTLAARGEPVLRGALILDAAIGLPSTPEVPSEPTRPNRIYPSLEAALARFRLAPPQPCPNPFVLDHIARHSLKEAPLEAGQGWTWRFDPALWEKLEPGVRSQADVAIRVPRCPLALVWAEQSLIVQRDNLAYTRSIAPPDMAVVSIPQAGHHLFLDQPIAVVAALRALLSRLPQ